MRMGKKEVLLAAILVASLATAGSRVALAKDAAVTVTGEVIDSACYIKMGAKGADHEECATKCAKAGIPLAILEEKTNHVWMVASDKDAESGNEKLLPFVAKKVTVTGKTFEKGGQKLLAISSVKGAS